MSRRTALAALCAGLALVIYGQPQQHRRHRVAISAITIQRAVALDRPVTLAELGTLTTEPRHRVARASRSAQRTSAPPATLRVNAISGRPANAVPLFWRIASCESTGQPTGIVDWTAQNKHSSASGAWQDLDSTWAGYGGYVHAKDAPPAVQLAFNVDLFRRAGTSPWLSSAGCWAIP